MEPAEIRAVQLFGKVPTVILFVTSEGRVDAPTVGTEKGS
jgi:hypothetical protein